MAGADRTTVFRVQAGFSFTVLVFCMGMLAGGKNPTYYLPIVTSIIGYWLPSPTYRGSSPVLPRIRRPAVEAPPPVVDVDVEAPSPPPPPPPPPPRIVDPAHLTPGQT